jgi:hypothetical protein
MMSQGKIKTGTDVVNRRERSKRRTNLLDTLEGDPGPLFPLTRFGKDVTPYTDSPGPQRYMVECAELRLPLNIEPIFAVMMLFDAQKQQRISENFYFDLNSPEKSQMVKGGGSGTLQHAIFSLSQPIKDVFVVVRFEKVLEDPVKVFDAYCKVTDDDGVPGASEKQRKAHAKLADNATAICERRGQHRMPFAWTAIPLFDPVALCRGPNSPTADVQLYQQTEKLADEELGKYIEDLGNKPQDWTIMKKAKELPGAVFKLRARGLPLHEQIPYCLTSTLYRTKPWEPRGVGTTPNGQPWQASLEVQEFPSNGILEPNRTYRHNLYVYVKSADFKSTSSRNIAVRVEFLDACGKLALDPQGLPLLYSHSACKLVQSVTTAVSYHTKSPTFYEEVKISLPAQMTENHHLLFSFFHVGCKDVAKGKTAERDTKPFGCAFFPLVKHHRLQTGDAELPVMVDLPPDYLMDRAAKVKWLDSKTPNFKAFIKLDSTVLSDDLYVQGFMLGVDNCLHNTPSEGDHIPVHNLRKNSVPPEALLEFLPTIMNQLLAILVHHPTSQNGKDTEPATVSHEAFGTLCHVVDTIANYRGEVSGGRSRDMLVYIKHMYHNYGPTGKASPPEKAGHLFEELTFWLGTALTYHNAPNEDVKRIFSVCVSHTWVFFELILKSAAQFIALNKRENLPRSQQLPARFTVSLHKVIIALVKALTEDRILPRDRAVKFNADLGFFLRDCLTFFDRTAGFRLVRETFKLLNCPARSLGKGALSLIPMEGLAAFRLDLLEILASHPQFVPLNLPDAPPKEETAKDVHAPALTPDFLKRHYLVGTLLHEVNAALQSPHPEIRTHALGLIRSVLSRHDHDARYQEKKQQEVLYGLYFPLLTIILQYAPIYVQPDLTGGRLPDPDSFELSDKERTHILIIFLHVMGKVNHTSLKHWWRGMVPKEQKQLMKMLEMCADAVAYGGNSEHKEHVKARGKLDDLQSMYKDGKIGGAAAALASGKRAGKTGGLRWSKQSRPDSEQSDGSGSAPRGTSMVRSSLASADVGVDRRPTASHSRHYSTASTATIVGGTSLVDGLDQFRYIVEPLNGAGGDGEEKDPARRVSSDEDRLSTATMGRRSTEGGLIILDCFEAFTEDLKKTMLDKTAPSADGETLMATAFAVLNMLLSKHQSSWMIRVLFSSLQTFVNKFGDVIYAGSTAICKSLCQHALKYCSFDDYEGDIQPSGTSSPWYKTREHASAFMYLLIRENHRDDLKRRGDPERSSGIARVQAQAMIAMSQTSDEKQRNEKTLSNVVVATMTDAGLIKRSLGTIVRHSKADSKAKPTKLPTLVQRLASNLTKIMFNTLQIETCNEIDTKIDLQYKIAKGYEGSPYLRQLWLKKLAKSNISMPKENQKRYAEAGFCEIHTAASIVNCLCDQGDPLDGFGKGAAAFAELSSNVENDEGKTDAHDAYDADTFEQGEVLTLLEDAAAHFSKAKLFEFQIAALKLGIPYYEKRRDAKKLQSTYANISDAYGKVIDAAPSRRDGSFGAYFRVGIFAKGLPDRVFIAKYPSYTPLAAVLENVRAELHKTMEGDDPSNQLQIEIVPHPNDISGDAAPSGTIQLQLTAVTPFGKDANASFFERFTRIKEFVFDTPITDGGKAHGGVKDQKLRRTVIKTERSLSFPYIRSRIDVKLSDVKHTVLEPIEIAIETVRNKTVVLSGILSQNEVDVKLLHLHLGGCVQAAVNGGPALYAEAFLGEGSEYSTPDQKKRAKELRREFGKLVIKCEEALKVNHQMMDESQRGLHEQFVLGLEGLKVIDERLKATDRMVKEAAAAAKAGKQGASFRTRPPQTSGGSRLSADSESSA